ncbi:hypothetical protein DPEC_G00242660 [Dallia pectoralis]|uniref:Uncharacterized protein n=1 Tax=Dallia pectoralis TaxID=75939 RepID=A0ACC2FVB2_DALPE|nr:hypothetical protein DPEC_G00242660 [Dallia pectoralis]
MSLASRRRETRQTVAGVVGGTWDTDSGYLSPVSEFIAITTEERFIPRHTVKSFRILRNAINESVSAPRHSESRQRYRLGSWSEGNSIWSPGTDDPHRRDKSSIHPFIISTRPPIRPSPHPGDEFISPPAAAVAAAGTGCLGNPRDLGESPNRLPSHIRIDRSALPCQRRSIDHSFSNEEACLASPRLPSSTSTVRPRIAFPPFSPYLSDRVDGTHQTSAVKQTTIRAPR